MRLCGGMAMRVCGGMCKCEEHWVCALQMSARVGHGAWETRHVCVCEWGALAGCAHRIVLIVNIKQCGHDLNNLYD